MGNFADWPDFAPPWRDVLFRKVWRGALFGKGGKSSSSTNKTCLALQHMYYYGHVPNRLFFWNTFAFLVRSRVFSRALGCGARRQLACTRLHHGSKCASRPRSVASALGLWSREFWQETTGRSSDLLEPSRTMETPPYERFRDFSLLLVAGCCCIMSDHAVARALWNDVATEQQQSHIKLVLVVTATDGATLVYVGRDSCSPIGSRDEHVHRLIGCAAQGAGRRYEPTLPRYFKSNRAATVRTTTTAAAVVRAIEVSHTACKYEF